MCYYLFLIYMQLFSLGVQSKPKPALHLGNELPSGFLGSLSQFNTISINSITSKTDDEIIPWHLDRLDQEELPLDGKYDYPNTGKGVNVYIISSGIYGGHSEFSGEDVRVFGAYSLDESDPLEDCLGFGTHIAGLIGGNTFGVAKQVNLHSVKVFNCKGLTKFGSILSAVEWISDNHVKPAVALWLTFSEFGTSSESSQKLNAVKNLHENGVTVVVGAGNSNQNACNVSPAKSPFAITVSGIDDSDKLAASLTSQDVTFPAANFGPCVDIFAPGSEVMGPWPGSADASFELSGTNTAPSIVAGIAALVLQNNTKLSPDQVKYQVIDAATKDVIKSLPRGTPNRLASVTNLSSPQAVAPVAQSIFLKLQNEISNQTTSVLGAVAPQATNAQNQEDASQSTSQQTGLQSTTPALITQTRNEVAQNTTANLCPINMEYTSGGASTYQNINTVVFESPEGFGILRGKDIIMFPAGTEIKSINTLTPTSGIKLFLLQVVSPQDYYGPVDVGVLDPNNNKEFIAITTYQVHQGNFVVRTIGHQY
eukprot:TRINITY_DN1003_c0_g1_i1.p1 TRINITY_DN1003_c0_g1~~TRINITY_DN1003_c0_g1_i1.p1  ORF type:complete len:538 (+),score=69.15 TRINITY_DN1003_c0_g1_i1:62-1675(+)